MANFNKFNMILSRLLFILVLLTLSAQALCEAYIHHHERQHGIPHNLLRAISRIESGRNVAGQGTVAWPWTINANGKPYVLNTKAGHSHWRTFYVRIQQVESGQRLKE